ncbi:MAG: methyltransferase domain-containing protein [Myxococcales bacterium]|nr:methyltransferase domain-containing protein [Myxococcales bacterium]
MTQSPKKTLEQIKEYYGQTLQKTEDLQTNACCTSEAVTPSIKSILRELDDEILARFYGCGSPIPDAIEGCTVLDLGCGTGRDVYVLSKLVGEQGQVIGVDMTDEQLAVARKHQESQAKRFGYAKPNTRFLQGYIEDLKSLDIADNSVDVVISNCVLNLSPDKDRVFSEIFRVLKPGGELYFSDIFADRRIPEALQTDPVLRGECLSGALYIEDFRRLLMRVGCPDYRIMSSAPVTIDNPAIEARIGMVTFASLTVRAFKIASLEDRCEDFGQVATYKGTISGAPHRFALDDHHLFETGRPMLVCGNTAAMLQESRLGSHFNVAGDRSQHFGLFDCGPSDVALPTADSTQKLTGGCC